MDYYEELGVEPSASAEDIRRAYKHLARLLHPDHCADEEGRRLADLQMKRLNGMMRILTNRLERNSYDRSLVPGLPAISGPPPPTRSPDWRAPVWLWPVLGAIVLAGMLPFAMKVPRPASMIAETNGTAAVPADVAEKLRSARAHPRERSAKSAKREARGTTDTLADHDEGSGVVGREAPQPQFAEPATVRKMAGAAASPSANIAPGQSQPVNHSLAGSWLFVPTSETRSAGLYPPEYIELRVAEEAGMLRGRYRARYQVRDKAISPTVAFEFEGPGSSDEAKLPWKGAGGAKGEITIRLLESGGLEVTWEAERMGAELGLISGTATLVRRLE